MRSRRLALTTSTSEGISLAIAGLAPRDGDEVLTSDEGHPGRDLRRRGTEVAVRTRRHGDALRRARDPRPAGRECNYLCFTDASRGLDAELHPDARRYDTPAMSAEASAFALAALEAIRSEGWPVVYERARSLASRLTERLVVKGRAVVPRGDTTLVSFHSDDPVGERARLAERGVVVRDIPQPALAASFGGRLERRGRPRAAARPAGRVGGAHPMRHETDH